MATSDRYASVLIALLDIVKQRGLDDAGSDVAEFCNQLAEEAIAQAVAWDIPLTEIGLADIDPIDMLRRKAA